MHVYVYADVYVYVYAYASYQIYPVYLSVKWSIRQINFFTHDYPS